MSAEEQRKLAAIMFTDIVGYSALSQRDEKLAQELLEEHREILREIFPRFNGTEIKTIGDAFLVEFNSALEAAQCAIEIQRALAHRNHDVAAERRIELKIGGSHWRCRPSRRRRLRRWSEHRVADRAGGRSGRDLCLDGRGTPDSQRVGSAL